MTQNEGPAPNWRRPNAASSYQLPCASLYTNKSPRVVISSGDKQYGRSHSAIDKRRIFSTGGSCSRARCIRLSAKLRRPDASTAAPPSTWRADNAARGPRRGGLGGQYSELVDPERHEHGDRGSGEFI